ncbi:MAG: hypothetical protein ACI9FR_000458 [Cryomorphaceae bacterium]|jgi:hypothetical protein
MFGFSTLLGCAVAPKKLDSLEQDTGSSFIRKVIVAENERTLLQRFSLKGSVSSSTNLRQKSIGNMFPQQTYTSGDVIRISFMGMPDFDGL